MTEKGEQQDFRFLRGRIALAQGDAGAAAADFHAALDLQVKPDVALEGAASPVTTATRRMTTTVAPCLAA